MISKIIELETLTPLFIKGKDLDYGEGMLRGSDGVVYLIDNDKLCEFIADNNKITEYVQEFDGRNKKPKLKVFLDRNGIYPNDSELKRMAKGITEISEKAHRDDEEQKNNFVQNGKKIPFIPGTSLKGAIRNAILWKYLWDNKNKSLLNTFFSAQSVFLDNEIQGIALISDALDKAEHKDFESADKKMNSLFNNSSFSKRNQFQNCKNNDGIIIYKKDFNSVEKKLQDYQRDFAKDFSKKKFHPNKSILPILKLEQLPQATQDLAYISMKKFNDHWKTAENNKSLIDFFRLVKVSDGIFIGDTSLKWLQLKTICKDNFGHIYKKGHTTTLECVPKAVQALFKITIDTELAKAFFPSRVPGYLQTVDELLKVVDEFFRTVAKFEDSNYYNGTTSIHADVNPNHKRNAKLRVNTNEVLNLYKITFGLEPDEILFRMGWGGGFMSKTQSLHLDMPNRVRVRDMNRYNGSPLAPKSRCLIAEGQNATEPLGWCKLRVLGDAKELALPSINAAEIKTDFLTEQPRQSGQQYRQGNRQNQERPATEKEIQQSKAEAYAIVKQAEKQKAIASQKTYKTGQKVETIVESSVLFQSVTVKIDDQALTLKTKYFKKPGDLALVEITEINDGKIIQAKVVK